MELVEFLAGSHIFLYVNNTFELRSYLAAPKWHMQLLKSTDFLQELCCLCLLFNFTEINFTKTEF